MFVMSLAENVCWGKSKKERSSAVNAGDEGKKQTEQPLD